MTALSSVSDYSTQQRVNRVNPRLIFWEPIQNKQQLRSDYSTYLQPTPNPPPIFRELIFI